ncbi:MAG: hypothetical protein K2N10_07770 [Muribaculaceae bacterium]|nr:hypothetical protein [Muribaculaceae bacterium]
MKTKFILMIVAAALAGPRAEAAKKRAATPKFTTQELMAQATDAFLTYNIDLANEKLAALRADKKADKTEIEALAKQVNRMDEMIQRVQDVAVIDSINVDREEFFRYYRLSSSAGRLLDRHELPSGFDAADETVVFYPEDGSVMIWGTEQGLVESRRLTDGSWEVPAELGSEINLGGTANYPFQLTDGSTLYFASDGDDSLGGLDLYITQRTRDGVAVPQNMGMPYNSPYDDYMLAIDEETGAGWFATDRNQLGNKVTIYVFVPTQTRVNINIDDPALADRARIASLSSPLSAEQQALLEKIAGISDGNSYGSADIAPEFEFPLPDGRVYTRWEDFKSPQARRLMENYIDALAESRTDSNALEHMRQRYSSGKSDNNQSILTLERKQRASQQQLKKLANQVIAEELNAGVAQ